MSKRAVVVGINDYSQLDPSGNSNLSCCVADASSMMDLLISAFGFDSGESVKLTDKSATSANIKSALRDVLNKSQPGDVSCFYYSGHGSRTPAASDQADCDKFYESIIPASGTSITDRDMFNLAASLEPSAVNFTVILDSCHSGGMDQETDALFKCKSPSLSDDLIQRLVNFLKTLIPCGILIPPDSSVCQDNVSNTSGTGGHVSTDEDADKVLVDQAKTTLIAGCKFDELSWETAGHGLLTNGFLNVVNASNFQIDYSDLLDQLRDSVTNDFNSQILPSLTGSGPMTQTPQLRGQRNRMSEGFMQGFTDSR